MIPYPNIDRVAFYLGPLKVHWYGISYILGICLCWLQARSLCVYFDIQKKTFDDFITYIVVGIILGGRLGYVLFYDLEMVFRNPIHIFQIWIGGMSFHGGLVGITFSTYIFAKKKQISFLSLGDILAIVSPIGLFLGRLANFINGEHYGRTTDVQWSMIFPASDGQPRHPSQLYEAALEGVLLWVILGLIFKIQKKYLNNRPKGMFIFLFTLGYGVVRFYLEYFREPDDIISFFGLILTIGQLLCLPMIIIGFFGIFLMFKKIRFRKSQI